MGYRISRYRAPVPSAVEGGTRVDRDGVDKLIGQGAILVDVLPAEGGSPDPATGTWRLLHPHQSIPGAIWLPETGRGSLTAEQERYLAENIARLSGGQTAKPIVVFCQADCWMSWNVVRRLAATGYKALYWFPEGTDGWMEWGDRKLETVTPEPLLPATHR